MTGRASGSPQHEGTCDKNCCAVCQSAASMECVACLRLGDDIRAVFCGPECFKAHWTQHRTPSASRSAPVNNRLRHGSPSPQHFPQANDWSTPTKLAPRVQYPLCHFEASQGLVQGSYRPAARRQLEVGVGYRMR